jgi:hypothetical protein
MTVWVADAHRHVQKLVLGAKMATVLEGVLQKSSVILYHFMGKRTHCKRNLQKNISCLLRKARNSLKEFWKSQMMPDQVRKWLRQQPKDFYAADFDTLVEWWGKCINVGGGYVEKYILYPGSNIICFTFISISNLFTDSPSYIFHIPHRRLMSYSSWSKIKILFSEKDKSKLVIVQPSTSSSCCSSLRPK